MASLLAHVTLVTEQGPVFNSEPCFQVQLSARREQGVGRGGSARGDLLFPVFAI